MPDGPPIPGLAGAAGYPGRSSLPLTGSVMSLVRSRRTLLPAAFVALSIALVGCGGGSQNAANGPDPLLPSDGGSSSAPPKPVAVVRANVTRGETGVPVDRRVKVTADNGTLTSVAVS